MLVQTADLLDNQSKNLVSVLALGKGMLVVKQSIIEVPVQKVNGVCATIEQDALAVEEPL